MFFSLQHFIALALELTCLFVLPSKEGMIMRAINSKRGAKKCLFVSRNNMNHLTLFEVKHFLLNCGPCWI